MTTLRSFDNFAGLEAARANFDALARPVNQGAYRLQIGIEAAAGFVVCVGNVIAELRAFAAEFTTISHNYLRISLVFLFVSDSVTEELLIVKDSVRKMKSQFIADGCQHVKRSFGLQLPWAPRNAIFNRA